MFYSFTPLVGAPSQCSVLLTVQRYRRQKQSQSNLIKTFCNECLITLLHNEYGFTIQVVKFFFFTSFYERARPDHPVPMHCSKKNILPLKKKKIRLCIVSTFSKYRELKFVAKQTKESHIIVSVSDSGQTDIE